MKNKKLIKDFEEFLSGKGFVVENRDEISQHPPKDYKYAKQIFNNKSVLLPLLLEITTKQRTNDRITFRPQQKEDSSILPAFLEGLKKTGHILEWKKKTESYDYEIRFSTDPCTQQFFAYEWAELCFRFAIMRIVQQFCESHEPRLHSKAFQNVKVRNVANELIFSDLMKFVQRFSHHLLPNLPLNEFQDITNKVESNCNLFTELDLVVQIEQRFYLFEVKGGPRVNIMQWAKREKAFVDKEGCVRQIVCTIFDTIPPDIFRPQMLMTLSGLEKELTELLEADFPSPPNYLTTQPPNHPTT